MSAPGRMVGVDELRRAWAAVQAGDFHRTQGRHPLASDWGEEGAEASPLSWCHEPGERVLPVVGCHGGAGGTTVAVAVAEAAAAATESAVGGVRVVECITANASGLVGAGDRELGTTGTGWVRSRRGPVLLERAGQVLTSPGDIPPPRAAGQPGTLTVLDVGWDLGQVLATRCWLRPAITHAQVVVLVAAATMTGLRRMEIAAALLGDVPHVCLAVVGQPVTRWPWTTAAAAIADSTRSGSAAGAARGEGTVGGTLRRLGADGLLVSVPADRHLALAGLHNAPLPAGVQHAARHLFDLTQPAPGLAKGPNS